jgi:xanthine dehydrogenase YagS FAD-binding subunit
MGDAHVTRYVAHDGGALAEGDEFLAGGTDLITLLRGGIHRPATLVDLKSGDLAVGIDETDTGWRIGAGTTLATIEDHEPLVGGATALTQAASSAATRQIRNRATIGGNLLQRSRCSYYRDESIPCWLKGADSCPARAGLHEHLAVVESGPCVTTQPSDPASALVALGATVTFVTGEDEVTIAVEQLLAAPTEADRRLHRLPHGAVVRSLDVPRPDGPSTYVKAMDRAAWQFALVGVAAVRAGDRAIVVASGIAATPHRLAGVTEALGTDWSDRSIDVAAVAAAEGLTPGPRNQFKVPLLQGLVRRALESLA